ncbi:MAG TPA: hypothetical protein VEP90_21165 [Methylomirabilota bacterium]|nr:hypothetical protein [Methylomirabilota bacterium]
MTNSDKYRLSKPEQQEGVQNGYGNGHHRGSHGSDPGINHRGCTESSARSAVGLEAVVMTTSAHYYCV